MFVCLFVCFSVPSKFILCLFVCSFYIFVCFSVSCYLLSYFSLLFICFSVPMLVTSLPRSCSFAQKLVRVRGPSSFDSGPAATTSTFFHTFDIPGTYYVTSVGTDQQVCRIDVLGEGINISLLTRPL